jgi:type I restriction enzyme M protein
LNRSPDFNQFGGELWEIANVFRDDGLHATERLETFSLFLFLKLWDEKEIEEEEELGRKKAPEEQLIPELYRFHNWALDPDGYARVHGFEDSIEFCRKMFNDLAKLDSKHPTAGLVRRLFSEHRFQLRYTTTVRALAIRLLDVNIRAIMSRKSTEASYDVFGRAYEYLLQKFGQNKEFAEYFTPRHIVDRMIQIIAPQPGELIYDPACGTCGFVVRAFEYVRDQCIPRQSDFFTREKMLRDLKEKHLFAAEKVGLVYKLGLMNMILHGDGSTHLENDDSLSSKGQDLHKGKYDVVLANPPFGPSKQERTAEFEFHIKLYEALFIQHIMNALKPGGQAAVVLKEGLLFDSKGMLRKICRKLVEQFEVLAVISLPNGVFNPYSGAKTSIVVFRRPLGRNDVQTSRVWFYRVDSDGRDLGATRRQLSDFSTDGDLEHMVKLFPYTFRPQLGGGVKAVLKADNVKEFESERSWWATVEEVRKNDYNLTAGRYCPYQAEAVEHEKPEVLINRLLELEEEIATDLQDLLAMVAAPSEPYTEEVAEASPLAADAEENYMGRDHHG